MPSVYVKGRKKPRKHKQILRRKKSEKENSRYFSKYGYGFDYDEEKKKK